MATYFEVEPTNWLTDADQKSVQFQFRRLVSGLGPYLSNFGTTAEVTGKSIREKLFVVINANDLARMTISRICLVADHSGFKVIDVTEFTEL